MECAQKSQTLILLAELSEPCLTQLKPPQPFPFTSHFPPVLLFNSFACHSSSCRYIYLLAFSLADGIACVRSFLIFHVAHPPVTTTNFIMLTSQSKQASPVFICAHSHCPGTSVVQSQVLTAQVRERFFCLSAFWCHCPHPCRK